MASIRFLPVLVCSGDYNKTPWIAWLTENRNSFLTGLETGKSTIKAPADTQSGEDPLSG